MEANIDPNVEPEQPIDCRHCGGLYDYRYWRHFSQQIIQCPDCGRDSRLDEALELTWLNTLGWRRDG